MCGKNFLRSFPPEFLMKNLLPPPCPPVKNPLCPAPGGLRLLRPNMHQTRINIDLLRPEALFRPCRGGTPSLHHSDTPLQLHFPDFPAFPRLSPLFPTQMVFHASRITPSAIRSRPSFQFSNLPLFQSQDFHLLPRLSTFFHLQHHSTVPASHYPNP